MNSWVSFLMWTASVSLARQCQASATSISTLINTGSLTSDRTERKIWVFFSALFLPTIAGFIYYNIYCVTDHDSSHLHQDQLNFVIISTAFLGVLLIALAYSLVQMQIVFKKKGVSTSHKMQILAFVALLLLFCA